MTTLDATIKSIPGVPGYLAGSDGTIWSAMPGRWGKYKSLHPIKTSPNPGGYLTVTLRPNGTRKTYTVHCLVATTFHGLRPDGQVVCHRNGDQGDNRPENLMYGTQAENIAQGVESGRHVRGTRQHLAKLTDETVLEIRRRRQGGALLSALATEFGVSFATISAVATGRTWRHVTAASA